MKIKQLNVLHLASDQPGLADLLANNGLLMAVPPRKATRFMDSLYLAGSATSRRSTCVTLARLTPRCRARAARFSNLPESSNAW